MENIQNITDGQVAIIVATLAFISSFIPIFLPAITRFFNRKKLDAETGKISSDEAMNEEKIEDIRQDRYLEMVDNYQKLLDRNVELSNTVDGFRVEMSNLHRGIEEIKDKYDNLLKEYKLILAENKVLKSENVKMKTDIDELKGENEEIRGLLEKEKKEKERLKGIASSD